MNEKLAQYLKGYESKYPHQLEVQFNRIVDRIVDLWETPEMEGYFSDLMFGGGRGNRRGFPTEVATEIFILSLAYEEIRKKPASGDGEDVWEQDGHMVTLAALEAHPHPARHPETPPAPESTSSDQAAPSVKPATLNPEFDQTRIAVNLPSGVVEAPLEQGSEPARVELFVGDHRYSWNTPGLPFTMGRDRGSNVFLTGEYASRHHARIEIRDGAVVLVDQSRNGTFVTLNGQAEIFVNNGELRIPPATSGILSFGISREHAARDLLHFTTR